MAYITRQELEDASADANTLEKFGNDPAGTPNINRVGNDVENMMTLRQRMLDAAADVANRQVYLTEAEMLADTSQPINTPARVETGSGAGDYVMTATGWEWSDVQPVNEQSVREVVKGTESNLIANGNLADGGAGFPQYMASSYATVAAPPLSAVTSATLSALGIQNSFKFPAGTLSTDVFASILLPSGDDSAYASGYASLLVSSSSGWADGTISPRLFYTYGAPGATAGLSTQLLAVSETNDIDATTREYVWRFEYPASLPIGQVVRGFNLGLVLAVAAASTAYEVSGFWLSTRKASISTSGPLLKEGTAYPDWGDVRSAEPQLSVRIESARKIEQNTRFFANLSRDLDNEFFSVRFGAIGDSIKRGNGATGAASTIPPGETSSNHTYAGQNPNNFDCRSQFNRMVARWVEAYSDQAQYTLGNRIAAIGQRIAYCTKIHAIPLEVKDARFTFRYLTSGREVPKGNIIVIDNAAAPYQGYVPIATIQASAANRTLIEFDMRGDNLTVNFAIYGSTQTYDLYLNDALQETVSISGSASWNGSHTHNFPYGAYRVRLVPTSSSPVRMIGFSVTRTIEMINFGISGTNSNEWQPGHASGLLGPVLSSDIDYCEVQLGTNDRAAASTWPPLHPVRTQRHIRTIVENIQTSMPRCKVLLSVTPAVPHSNDFPDIANYYGQRDIARVIKQLAVEKRLDFVDQYTPFVVGMQNGLTLHYDDLHPNDPGYGIMDDTWEGYRSRAAHPYYSSGVLHERLPGMNWG